MKYYIIAGEASGDLHGSNLIKAIRKRDPEANIRAWGGDKMQAAGADVVKHISELAFMGFAEVVKNLPTVLRNMQTCKSDIRSFAPDVVILIDYPGFNLRIADWAKAKDFKVVFYISPQIWAWKESRIKQIKRSVDKMLVIFPFEKTFYEKWDYKVDYVGHPLVPVVDEYMQKMPEVKDKDLIALLPGSRKQEIKKKLPAMLLTCEMFPEYRFKIAKAPSIDEAFYLPYLSNYENVELTADSYRLLNKAQAAVVTSGTATLETALFDVPQVVVYKTSKVSYTVGRWLVRLKFICIVNLIMNKEVVKELIQNEMNPENIASELKNIIPDTDRRRKILDDYRELRRLLEFRGNASDNAAALITEAIEK